MYESQLLFFFFPFALFSKDQAARASLSECSYLTHNAETADNIHQVLSAKDVNYLSVKVISLFR